MACLTRLGPKLTPYTIPHTLRDTGEVCLGSRRTGGAQKVIPVLRGLGEVPGVGLRGGELATDGRRRGGMA